MCLRSGVDDNKVKEEGKGTEQIPPVKKAAEPPQREEGIQ
jgi:hypothetical protein